MMESQVFQVLADPTRRAVFEKLCRQEMSVAEITAGFPSLAACDITALGAPSTGAGWCASGERGAEAYYRSDPAGLEPLAAWMERYRQFWPERLQKLKRVLKEVE